MNILWVLNKYVDGGSLSRYYPEFLHSVEKQAQKNGHKVYFIFFSDAMKAKSRTNNNLFFSAQKIAVKDALKRAEELEIKYAFTFRQAYFPDIIQVSREQDYRQINLSEREISVKKSLVEKFLYLEKVIDKKKIEAVICDQSSEVEMEFARTICQKSSKIFMRHMSGFLGKSVFARQFGFGEEQTALPVLDKSITFSSVKKFVDDFVKNNRRPYIYPTFLKRNFKEFYLPRIFRFYLYPQFIKLFLMQPYLLLEDKILKRFLRSRFNKNVPYLFFGLHLPTESTVALRSLPYMNQISLIESISRVLPYGYYLYVREHPWWRKRFSYSRLKLLKKMPNVRLISTDIPIGEIIRNSRGVLTYNSTTGIEALIYGKPVLSFAANVYSGIHPAADYCGNLYSLGAKLAKLIGTKVDRQDTYQYIFSLMRSSTDYWLYAGTFLSTEESQEKGKRFAGDLMKAIEYVKSHPVCNKNK